MNDLCDSYILHGDLDAFFASVEQLLNPHLLGKPILVGGRPENRGVVATASYEARSYGIHSAMPMKRAIQLCPNAIIVEPHFAEYKKYSLQVIDILRKYSEIVEVPSLDEAYLDISENVSRPSDVLNIGLSIKNAIHQEVGLTMSIGISSTKSTSKIASDLGKPDGLIIIPFGQEMSFISGLNVNKIPGVGPKTTEKLHSLGIKTVGELANQSNVFFSTTFGSQGHKIKAKANGNYKEPLQTDRSPKVISTETTFAVDLHNKLSIIEELHLLSSKLSNNAQQKNIKGKTIRLKIRFDDFKTSTNQLTLISPTNQPENIKNAALVLLDKMFSEDKPIRLLGLSLTNFNAGEQLMLEL